SPPLNTPALRCFNTNRRTCALRAMLLFPAMDPSLNGAKVAGAVSRRPEGRATCSRTPYGRRFRVDRNPVRRHAMTRYTTMLALAVGGALALAGCNDRTDMRTDA